MTARGCESRKDEIDNANTKSLMWGNCYSGWFCLPCLTHQARRVIFSIMNNNSSTRLGQYLRSLRDARGLTLRQVEASCGISNAFLSQVESGKVKSPSPTILYKLADLFDASYERLLEMAEYPLPDPNRNMIQSASTVFQRLGPISEDEEQALLDYLSFLRTRDKKRGHK
jgi:transcriptional regulator with XRE-family HTH domain